MINVEINSKTILSNHTPYRRIDNARACMSVLIVNSRKVCMQNYLGNVADAFALDRRQGKSKGLYETAMTTATTAIII